MKLHLDFSMAEDLVRAYYLSVDVRKLPKVELTDQIYRNDTRDSSTDKLIRVTWFVIHRNRKYEITGRFLKKVKRCELLFGKVMECVKGYDFCDPRAPDVLLHGTGDTPWKVVLKYDYANHCLALFINDQPVAQLPL